MSINGMNRREEPWSGKRDATIKQENHALAVTINLNNMENPPPRREESWENKAMDEASVVSNVPSHQDSKKKRSWKKPKDKPMRPLSAYNMFFQNQRERIVAGKTGDPTPEEIQQSVIKMLTSKTRGPKRRQDRVSHGQISFGDLARTIAAKWKAIDPKLKAIYNHYAAQEKIRYKKEVVIWKEKKEREHDAAMSAKQNNNFSGSISSSFNDSMASMSSSVTSMSASFTNSYNLSESINSLQNGGNGISGGGVNMQLNDDVVQRQQNILRQQMGFIDSKLPAHGGGGGSGNDDVLRDMPNDRGRGGDNGFSFPRPIGGDGTARSMSMMKDEASNQNTNRSMLESNLQRRNQQQQQFNRKEQLLLELQQQQLQQLQQLQQARLETSRLSNMKTTDTTSTFMDSIKLTKMNSAGSSYREYPPPSLATQRTPTISNSKHIGRHPNNDISKSKHLLREQFKELEDITVQLNRLKEQERQMQQKIKEHQHGSNSNGMNGNGMNNNGMSGNVMNNNGVSGNAMNNNGMNSNGMNNNGMWADNMPLHATFNDTPSGIRSSNYNSAAFQDHNNDGTGGVSSLFSTFDADINDIQRKPVRRSRSGDTNLYRGNSSTSNPSDGNSRERNLERLQPRRHSMLGAENVNNDYTGFSSVPNSFNFGPKGQSVMQQQNSGDMGIQENRQQHQGQNHGRRDSLAALLHLDDVNIKDGTGGRERRSNGQDGMSPVTLSQVLELQEAVNSNNQDIGAIFNMDLEG
jgi:hypothetical protein